MGAKGSGRRIGGGGRRGAGGGGATEPQPPAAAAPAAAAPAAGGGGLTVAKQEAAFNASPRAEDNHVSLADFRDRLGGTRAEQDVAIRQGQRDGRWSLDTHEGLYNGKNYEANKDRYKAAGIPQPGGDGTLKPFWYISRR